MIGFDATFLILGIILTLLNILDQLLKKVGKSPTDYIRKKIKNNSKKIEASLKSYDSKDIEFPIENIDTLVDDLVDDLIDLSEKMTFNFKK